MSGLDGLAHRQGHARRPFHPLPSTTQQAGALLGNVTYRAHGLPWMPPSPTRRITGCQAKRMNEEMNLTPLGLDATSSPMGMPIWKWLAPERKVGSASGRSPSASFLGLRVPT